MKIKLAVALLFGMLTALRGISEDLTARDSMFSGDLAQFIQGQFISFGGNAALLRTVITNRILCEWRGRMDSNGIQLFVHKDRFEDIQKLMQSLFGAPSLTYRHAAGGMYAASVFGAGAMYHLEEGNYPPTGKPWLTNGCVHVVVIKMQKDDRSVDPERLQKKFIKKQRELDKQNARDAKK